MSNISYGRQDVRAEDIEAVVAVLRSDWLTQGPTIARFEQALTDSRHLGGHHSKLARNIS